MSLSVPASRRVDAYIEALPAQLQSTTETVRQLLFEIVPQLEERFSFGLPFYHYYGMFCYLRFNKQMLHVCFCRGKDLLEAFPQLELKGRAAIASVALVHRSDLITLEIDRLLAFAADWNKEAAALKIPMVKRKKL